MKRIQCIIGLIKAPRNWENELADISFLAFLCDFRNFVEQNSIIWKPC